MTTSDVRIEVEPAATPSVTWSRLALRSGNIFSTYEWASLWRQHFHRDRAFGAVTIRSGPEPFAILPFVGSRFGPLCMVRLAGHGLADELGPVCDPADLPLVAPHLPAAVRAFQPDADLLVGDVLSGRIHWDERVGGRVVAREASPVLRVAGRTWDEFLADHSRNFRKALRTAEGRVMKQTGAVIRRVDAPADLPQALDWLFALHRTRWGPGTQFSRTEAFHRDFAAAALDHGWLRLLILQVEGRPVAVWYGFRFASAVSGYQSGRDPGWERYSVGRVLRARAIRAAMEEGADEFRFLRGDERHKWRFADHDDGVVTLGVPFSPLGSAGLVGYRLASRLVAMADVARLRIGQVRRRRPPS
jgi:CelD/BcsL family acetyltransferase involved in cellulose biosynthesis